MSGRYLPARNWLDVANHIGDAARDATETVLKDHLPDLLASLAEDRRLCLQTDLTLKDGRVIRFEAALEMLESFPAPMAVTG